MLYVAEEERSEEDRLDDAHHFLGKIARSGNQAAVQLPRLLSVLGKMRPRHV